MVSSSENAYDMEVLESCIITKCADTNVVGETEKKLISTIVKIQPNSYKKFMRHCEKKVI